MELRRYLALLVRGWWVILVATAVVYFSLTTITSKQAKIYSASTALVVSPSPAWVSNYKEILDALSSLDKRGIIVTYETVLGSDTIRDKAIAAIQLPPDKQSNLKVVAQAISEANAVQITVEASGPQVAADMANAIAQQGINDLKNLYQVYELTQLDPAVAPTTPIRPNPAQAYLGLPLGALLGIALVLFMNYLRIPVPSLIPQFGRGARGTQPLVGRASLEKLVQSELRRLPARQRELGVVMAALPAKSGAEQLSPELLRPYLQAVLRHSDTIVSLPENNSLAVIMPGSNKVDADGVIAQVRQRLAQDAVDARSQINWAAAAYDRGDANPTAVIDRASAGLRADRGSDAALAGRPAGADAFAQGRAPDVEDQAEALHYA